MSASCVLFPWLCGESLHILVDVSDESSLAPELFRCPACEAMNAWLNLERYGVRTFYCPDCEHIWDEDVDKRPPTQR